MFYIIVMLLMAYLVVNLTIRWHKCPSTAYSEREFNFRSEYVVDGYDKLRFGGEITRSAFVDGIFVICEVMPFEDGIPGVNFTKKNDIALHRQHLWKEILWKNKSIHVLNIPPTATISYNLVKKSSDCSLALYTCQYRIR